MSFIHATFLAAGLAIAIPWMIHLTRKRKYLRIRLGSLQFLDPIVRDRHRMNRVEQWPLLLARCAALLLLALIFARPFFAKPSTPPPGSGESIILLDASGSITPKQADIIRKQAEETIASLPASTPPVIAMLSDRVEIISSLDAYRPIPGSPGDYSTAVDWIVDRATRADNPIGTVHWFTDLQRSALPSAPSRLWPSGLHVEIHPTLPPTDRNVSIGQIDLLTPFGRDTWEVEARVHVHGMPGDQPIDIQLVTSEGKTVTAKAPQEGGAVKFKWNGGTRENILSGTVSLATPADSWPADDRRPYAFATTSPSKVILVDGDPGTSIFTSETYFLEKALHASAAGKTLSPFRASIVTKMPKPGDKADVIALCNPDTLSSEDARILKAHIDQGGGLAIFLGDRTQPSGWTAAVSAGIFPAGLGLLPEAAPAFIRRSDLKSPMLAGLNSDSSRGLALVPLMRHFTWPRNDGWTSVMDFDENSPLLLVSSSGKIAIFSHPVNREGSDLPLSASFVPLMQGLFARLALPVAASGAATRITSTVPGLTEKRLPGLYEASGGFTLVAADAPEADIASAPEKSFRELLGLPAADAPAPTLAPQVTAPASAHQREGELWPWILAVLLALLTVESILAARRARPTLTTDAHVN